MTDELTKKEKPLVVNLGGKDYTLPMINLNILDAIEEEFNCGLDKIKDMFEHRQAGTLRTLVWVILREAYPDLTKEFVGSSIKAKDIGPVSERIFELIKTSMEV